MEFLINFLSIPDVRGLVEPVAMLLRVLALTSLMALPLALRGRETVVRWLPALLVLSYLWHDTVRSAQVQDWRSAQHAALSEECHASAK